MIYSTHIIEQPAVTDPTRTPVHRGVNELALERSQAMKMLQRQPGHISGPPAEREYGDLVLVMVDPGEGQATRDAICQMIEKGL